LGAAEGAFQVHHPILSIEWPQPSGEDFGLCQELQVSVEAELAIQKSLFESSDELATKNFLQHIFGQEVVVPRMNPAGVIGGEAPGRDDAMDMGTAPRCFGSRATWSSVSALERNRRPYMTFLFRRTNGAKRLGSVKTAWR
jgi:hypothetical protein